MQEQRIEWSFCDGLYCQVLQINIGFDFIRDKISATNISYQETQLETQLLVLRTVSKRYISTNEFYIEIYLYRSKTCLPRAYKIRGLRDLQKPWVTVLFYILIFYLKIPFKADRRSLFCHYCTTENLRTNTLFNKPVCIIYVEM